MQKQNIMISLIMLLVVLFTVFVFFCKMIGKAPDFVKSYHIYKYQEQYFVKIKMFAYITLRYADRDNPLRYTSWDNMGDLKHCLVDTKEQAEKIIEILKQEATEVIE